MKNILYIILALSFILVSCHKDEDTEETKTTEEVLPEIDNAQEGQLTGIVFDDSGNPVQGVKITSYGKTTTTDINGVFKIDNTLLSPTGSYIKAEKEGYHLGSDLVFSSTNNGYSKIMLLALDRAKTFPSDQARTIEIAGGGELSFPENAFKKVNGNDYNGQVTVFAKRIATDDDYFEELMPGGLFAQDKKGRSVVLGSMGMMAVELRGSSGEELQLKEGVSAKGTFPIADHQAATAEPTIETWSFDEAKGIWVEEGIAIKKGNVYETELTHFSFWNCDAPFPLIKLSGQFKDNEGNPLKYLQLSIESNNYGVGYGYTDLEGFFCGLVPKNETFILKARAGNCEEPIYIESYGPYTTTTDIGMIILDVSDETVSVQVKCDDEVVAPAYILVNDNVIWTQNGSFSFHLPYCSDEESIVLVGVNADSGEASQEVEVVVQDLPAEIDLQVCDASCDFEIEITSNADNVCNVDDVVVSALVTGGSGDFIYEWSDGYTSIDRPITNSADSTLVCVEVTEVGTECTKNECKMVFLGDVEMRADIEFYYECNDEQVTVILGVFGGVAPYTVEIVETGETYTVNDNEMPYVINFDVVDFGEYIVKVTDSQGCYIEKQVFLDGNNGYNFEILQSGEFLCDGGEITLTALIPDSLVSNLNWVNGDTGIEITVTEPGEYCAFLFEGTPCASAQCVYIESMSFYREDVMCANSYYILNNGWDVEYTNNTYLSLANPNNPEYITISNGTNCSADIDIIDNSAIDNFVVNNTTCGTCEDGYITWDNVSDQIFCEYCTFSESKILKVSDIENGILVDYTEDNDNQSLAKGDYVLVGGDDCLVARMPFTIE